MSTRAARAFIVRPFGKKKDAQGNEIDFDAVERELLAPALRRLGIQGGTTIDIVEAGNIRIDMFRRLLMADLVVADLSIHNANVFYELGIRHALRNCHTFMLRCDADRFPFDLQTDRYFVYKSGAPGDGLDALVEALRRTLDSRTKDSPVFMSLPNLKEQDISNLLPVPLDFGEEVDRAVADEQMGDLELLAAEVTGLEWGAVGLRTVGRAQFRLKAYAGARRTWEAMRKLDENDLEANIRLGTIYERLGDLTGSTQALKRALEAEHIREKDRAEAYALLARNSKTHWEDEWRAAPAAERPARALRSRYLEESFVNYERAYEEDINHFYSGLNALAMLTIITELAAAEPKAWAARFKTPRKAEEELEERLAHAAKLAAAVGLALDVSRRRLEQAGEHDEWVEISAADLACLTSDNTEWVAGLYEGALSGASDFAGESAREQLAIYNELGVRKSVVEEVLRVTGPPKGKQAAGPPRRTLLFTGHMIDAPGREKPRFPNTAEAEGAARAAIRAAVEREMQTEGGVEVGFAGGANGGDIIFLEVCAELGVPTWLYLGIPPEPYVAASVRKAGPAWVERFWRLQRAHEEKQTLRVLSNAEGVNDSRDYLPAWLRSNPDYGIWQRTNLWLLFNALVIGRARSLTLIALWDGEDTADGPGGTGDLVRKVNDRGARAAIINTKELFGL